MSAAGLCHRSCFENRPRSAQTGRTVQEKDRAGTRKQVVGGCLSLDNPPVVNGLHHPTGVYHSRSTIHLLPFLVMAATPSARENFAAKLPIVLRSHDFE